MKNFTLLALLALISCASTEENKKDYCHSQGAFDKGYLDGKRNLNLTNKALDFCPSNKAKLMMQYREGYYKGQEIYAKEPKIQASSALGSSPNVSLPRKCIMQFRGDTFLGEGYSFGEAMRNAQSKCSTVYGSEMCGLPCENLPEK